MKVVSSADSTDSGICQNPKLASSLVKTFAPAICAKICSTAGMGCRSLFTLLLSLVRSTQMRTFPFFLGTTTIPAHQSVGSFTLAITPWSSIRVSSSLTAFINGIGTLREVPSADGCTLSSSWIVYSPFNCLGTSVSPPVRLRLLLLPSLLVPEHRLLALPVSFFASGLPHRSPVVRDQRLW